MEPVPPPDFAGREAELQWLLSHLDTVPVLLVGGLPGAGKTSLLAAFARRAGRPARWLDCRETRSPLAELEAARRAGALLFADDLHALGSDLSTALVRAAVGSPVTALVAATREPPALGPLDSVRVAELKLGGLGEEPCPALGGLHERAHEWTGGNPLALRVLKELSARSMADPGALAEEMGRAGLDAMLERSTPAQRRTLEALALLQAPGLQAVAAEVVDSCAGPQAPLAALERRYLAVATGGGWALPEPLRSLILIRLPDEDRRRWELEIGRAYEGRGDAGEAHEHYCRAGSVPDTLRALQALRVQLGRQGRYRELLERIERTAPVAAGAPLAGLRARALASLGDTRQALSLLKLERERAAGDKAIDAMLLACQAEVLRQAGDMQRALRSGYDALQRAEESGEPEALVASLELLSILHADLGDLPKALGLMKRASAARGGERASRALALEAALEEQAGRLEGAARLYELALEGSSEASDRADLLLKLAANALARDELDEALERASRARDVARACADGRAHGRALLLLGTAERARGRHEAALTHLDEAVELASSASDQVLALLERGEILRVRGDYRSASRDFARALASASDLSGSGLPVRALALLGALAADRGEYARAGETFRQAMERSKAATGQAGSLLVEVLCGLAAVRRGRGEFVAAAQLLEQAQRSVPGPASSRTARSAQARVLLEKAALARVRGDYRAGLSAAVEGSEAAREAGDGPLGARLLIETASLHRENGDYSRALETLVRALGATRAMGDRFGIALCLLELARCHQERGEYTRAERFHKRGLLMARRLDASHLVARFLNASAHIEADRGRFREALQLYRQAQRILRGLSDRKELQRTLGGIADIHRNRREFPAALRKIEECLRMAEGLPDPAGVARALSQLSSVHALTGNYTVAVAHQERSLRIKEELGDVRGIVESLTRLTRIHLALRQPSVAEPLLDRGLKIAREYELGRNEVILLEERAALELAAGRFDQAESLAGDAIAAASGLEYPEGLARGYRLMGLLEKRRGRLEVSQRHLSRALKHFRRLRRDAETEELTEEVKSVSRQNLDGLLDLRGRMLADTERLEREIFERHGRHAVLLLAEIPGHQTVLAQRNVESAMEHLERTDALLVPRILSFGGTLVRHVGDRALALFEAADRALASAVSIRSALTESNGSARANTVRIGLHCGTVTHDGQEVAGQVVEVLGRLPGLAGEHGIALTAEFKRQLGESPRLEPVSGVRSRAGEPELRVYRVL